MMTQGGALMAAVTQSLGGRLWFTTLLPNGCLGELCLSLGWLDEPTGMSPLTTQIRHS